VHDKPRARTVQQMDAKSLTGWRDDTTGLSIFSFIWKQFLDVSSTFCFLNYVHV